MQVQGSEMMRLFRMLMRLYFLLIKKTIGLCPGGDNYQCCTY